MSKSEAKHTPGPWEPHLYESGGFEIVSVHERNFIITSRNGYQEWDRKNESVDNARLIAAAPELLEALEECIDHMTNSNDCTHGNGFTYDFCPVEKARAAIAKARGEQ